MNANLNGNKKINNLKINEAIKMKRYQESAKEKQSKPENSSRKREKQSDLENLGEEGRRNETQGFIVVPS